MHSGAAPEKKEKLKEGTYELEGGSLANMERSFAKKYQSYQNLCFKDNEFVKVCRRHE